MMRRADPTTKSYLVPSVSSAKVEKLPYRQVSGFLRTNSQEQAFWVTVYVYS